MQNQKNNSDCTGPHNLNNPENYKHLQSFNDYNSKITIPKLPRILNN
jgi:hypothetical protein